MSSKIDKDLEEFLKNTLDITDKDEIKIIFSGINNDLEKVRLRAALSFLNYSSKLDEHGNGYTFRLLGAIFVLESLVAVKEKYKLVKLKKLIKENLEFEDKILLLSNFIFSGVYEFKKRPNYPLRHLMFKDVQKDFIFLKKHLIVKKDCKYCFPRDCSSGCIDWLRENPVKINNYTDKLVEYLYEMRCAVVHESFPVIGLPDYSEKHTAGSFSASVLDCYPCSKNKKHFRSYETTIDPDEFFKIIKKCIRNYLCKNKIK